VRRTERLHLRTVLPLGLSRKRPFSRSPGRRGSRSRRRGTWPHRTSWLLFAFRSDEFNILKKERRSTPLLIFEIRVCQQTSLCTHGDSQEHWGGLVRGAARQ